MKIYGWNISCMYPPEKHREVSNMLRSKEDVMGFSETRINEQNASMIVNMCFKLKDACAISTMSTEIPEFGWFG